jgi:hypothetical protein
MIAKMSSKVLIPIAVAISVIVTAGIMYGIVVDQQSQVSQTPTPEIIYVDKSISEFFEGTNDIKKISSQEELKDILEASSLFSGSFYDTRIRTMVMDDSVMFETAQSIGAPVPSIESRHSD